MSQAQEAPLTVEQSMQKLRESIRQLEKICVQKENDVKARQQDLFGVLAPAKNAQNHNNVVQLDLNKIQKKLDETIEQVENLLGEEAS